MKTSREEIIQTALRLFAERGFEAVSTSMIAVELNITKGALYRHFDSKQAIFDAIIQRMFELDARQAEENHVPAGTYEQDAEGYRHTALADLCRFTNEQFLFWTENEFARLFRRMITIGQFKTPEMGKLYQDVIGLGPVRYTVDMLGEMLQNGQLKEEAVAFGLENVAVQLFAPLQLSLQFYDGGEDPIRLQANLRAMTRDFALRWTK